jgi:DNA mismatch repair ATPase MutS
LAIGRGDKDGAEDATLGLAWLDVSTGEFFAQVTNIDGLRDEVARIGPQEVVLDRYFESTPSDPIRKLLADEGCFVSYTGGSVQKLALENNPRLATPADATDDLTTITLPDPQPRTNLDDFEMGPIPESFSPRETVAIRLLTSFLRENLMEHAPTFAKGDELRAQRAGVQRMQIDAHTIKALEIREAMREGGQTGTLMSVVKRTVTSSGTRLLARWLCGSLAGAVTLS